MSDAFIQDVESLPLPKHRGGALSVSCEGNTGSGSLPRRLRLHDNTVLELNKGFNKTSSLNESINIHHSFCYNKIQIDDWNLTSTWRRKLLYVFLSMFHSEFWWGAVFCPSFSSNWRRLVRLLWDISTKMSRNMWKNILGTEIQLRMVWLINTVLKIKHGAQIKWSFIHLAWVKSIPDKPPITLFQQDCWCRALRDSRRRLNRFLLMLFITNVESFDEKMP